jgi:hypothetical protein
MATTITNDEKHRFSEFRWLEDFMEALFKCLSILAEPFLAFGLIASGIDYGMHGKFLSNVMLMNAWTITQGVALEGSGGVALAMSFESASEGDKVKCWCQRILAIALLLVGGIMFFVEISQGALGGSESSMPPWYVYLMSALRALVSLGYIAMRRTKKYRFSGTAPEVVQMQSMQDAVQSAMQGMQCKVQEALQAEITKLHDAAGTALHAALTAHLTETVQSLIAGLRTDLVGIVQNAVEQENAEAVAVIEEQMQRFATAQMGDIHQTLSNDVRRLCTEFLQSVHITEVQQAQPALNAPRSAAVQSPREPHTDALQPLHSAKSDAVQSAGAPLQPADDAVQSAVNDAASGGYKAAILAYVQLQYAQGHEPTAPEIMAAVHCGERTAFKYRKEALLEVSNAQ